MYARAARQYAGTDRRQSSLNSIGPPSGEVFTLISASVVIGGLAVPLALGRVLSQPTLQMDFTVLRVAAALLLTAAGVMNLLRWRMTGEAVLALAGSAVVLYGTLGVVPALLRLSMPEGYVSVVRLVNAALVLVLFAWSLSIPAVSTRVRPGRLLAGGFGAALLAYVLLDRTALPALLREHWTVVYVGVAFTGAWTLLGAAAFAKGRRRAIPRFSWLGLTAMALAFAEAAQAAALSRPDQWLIASGTLRTIAGAVWCVYAGRELLAVISDQGENLVRLHERLGVAMARLDEASARDEERAHDARAALCAVQSAVATLTGYYERLESQTRSQLERAVDSELTRLRELLDRATIRDLEYFDLAGAIEPVVTAYRSYGMSIDLQVGNFCWVHGRPADTATVVQTLLENARRHAPGSPVTVRVSRVGTVVALAVEDRGPGIPRGDRVRIFDRGVRGSHSERTPGSGLGLFIAARLMRDQHGEISVRDGLGGGACFVLSFAPAPATRKNHEVEAVALAHPRQLTTNLEPA